MTARKVSMGPAGNGLFLCSWALLRVHFAPPRKVLLTQTLVHSLILIPISQ